VAFLELREASKTFRIRDGPKVEALQRVSLSIDEGEFVTVVGRSGCGKSTLLRLIAGLLDCTSGSIHLGGQLVDRPISDVGFVFQAPVLLPWKNVLDNVLFSALMLGVNPDRQRDRALELLELAGLSGFERAYPAELSGGMQQRVAICRALVHDPRLLLMDEPFGALDAFTREEMGFHLLRMWDSERKTIIFVTHSITEAVLLADRVIVMARAPGRVVRDVRVDLERPRTPDHEFTGEFDDHARELRALLFDQRPTGPPARL
jgi:NitT/TauT family transport system ATP-binding protein